MKRPLLDYRDRSDFKIEEYAAIVISVVALLVSAISAYFSTIAVVDDVRLSLDGESVIRVDLTAHTVTLTTKSLAYYFINLGNRSEAISRGSIWFDLSSFDGNPISCDAAKNRDGLSFSEPVVIKANEIARVTSRDMTLVAHCPGVDLSNANIQVFSTFYLISSGITQPFVHAYLYDIQVGAEMEDFENDPILKTDRNIKQYTQRDTLYSPRKQGLSLYENRSTVFTSLFRYFWQR
jgi:hypothetical protein